MAALRKELPPPLPSELPRALDQVTARCLQPEATERYSSARELSAALEGCRHYQAAERTMPDFGRMRAIVARRPVVWLFLLALAPHLLATFINIAYNDIRIISGLDPTQRAVFVRIVCWYDVIGYSIGIILGLRIVLPVARTWRAAAERCPATGRRSTPRGVRRRPGRSGRGGSPVSAGCRVGLSSPGRCPSPPARCRWSNGPICWSRLCSRA